jgi:hypothetical protein
MRIPSSPQPANPGLAIHTILRDMSGILALPSRPTAALSLESDQRIT